MQNTKRDYAAPAVTKIGSFEDITQATNVGTRVDATLPTGTPIGGHLELS